MTLRDVWQLLQDRVDESRELRRMRNFFRTLDTFRAFDDIGGSGELRVIDPHGAEYADELLHVRLCDLHICDSQLISLYN